MRMTTGIKHILLGVFLLLGASCVREEQIPGPNIYLGETLPLDIRLGSRTTGDDPDGSVTTMRAIVFNDKGQLVCNEVTTATPDGNVYTARAKAARGTNHFYIICNETEELAGKLSQVTRQPDIEQITFSAVGLTAPAPMYGKVTDAWVSSDSDGSNAQVTVNNVTTGVLPVQVNRMAARFSFTAIKNITGGEDFAVTELRIRVCRMPAYTTIAGNAAYTDDKWSDRVTMEKPCLLDKNGAYTVSDNTYTVPEGLDRIEFPDIYIPENLLETPADRSRATYLKIEAQCRMKDGTDQIRNVIYTLNIGQAPPQNHNLKRNNHYNIYATITGLGAMGIYADIVPMDLYEIPVTWKPIEGLVIVSDKASDFDFDTGTSKNVNVWSDYNVYSGILKAYHENTGYEDLLFRYGSVVAVSNNAAGLGQGFTAPTAAETLNDILWYPSSYGNPYNQITGWTDIPYLSSGDIPVDNSRVGKGLGDPCKLAGLSEIQIRDEGITDNGQWHMATPDEYALLVSQGNGTQDDSGYGSFHLLHIPNVNYRDANGRLTAGADDGGQYWTTTGVLAFGFTHTPSTSASVMAQDPGRGYTVRCVRNVIPASDMSVSRHANVSYQGNTTTGVTFGILSNIPYWTATLIESGDDAGTATEPDDFSFAPGESVVHATTGNYNQNIPVYVKRKESLTPRTFRVKVEGTGLDGNRLSKIVTVTQEKYSLWGRFTNLDKSTIPQAGIIYNDLQFKLTPDDIAFPEGDLWIEVYYNKESIAKSQELPTEPDKYTYGGFSVTVPANGYPDMRGLTFEIKLRLPDGSEPIISGNNDHILQDKK